MVAEVFLHFEDQEDAAEAIFAYLKRLQAEGLATAGERQALGEMMARFLFGGSP